MTLSPPHCGSVAPLVRSCRPPPQAPHFPLPTFTNFSPFLFAFLYLDHITDSQNDTHFGDKKDIQKRLKSTIFGPQKSSEPSPFGNASVII